ncbi:hypothetical protein M8J76_007139 [Diaphorina citri]|nr:hypothetical protein M8J76_007139 [Diaphorina citri]
MIQVSVCFKDLFYSRCFTSVFYSKCFISVFRSRCFTARERLLYWMSVAVLLCLSSFSTVTLGISIPDVTKEPSPILPPSVSDDFDQILKDHDQTSPLDQLPNKSSKIDNISHVIPTESSHGSDHIVRRNNDELGRVRRNHETPERNFERCGTTRDDKTIDENSDVESDEEPETLKRNFETDGLTREGKTNENNDGVDNGSETDERNHEKRKTVERNEDEPETPERNLETGGKTRGGKTNEYDDGWNEFNKPVKNSDEKEETLERNYENQIDDPTVDAKTNVDKYDGVQSDDEAIDKTSYEVETKDSQKANNINKNKLDEHEQFGTHVQTQIGEPQSKLARQKTILNNLKQEIENYKSHVTHNFDNNNNKSEDDAEYIEAFKNSPMSKSKEIKEVLEELDTKNKVEGTNGNSEVEADIKIKDHVIVNKGVTFVTNEDDREANGKKPETFVKKDSYGTKDNGHVNKPRGLVKDSSVDHKPEGSDKDNSIVHKPEESHKDNGVVHKPEESDKDNGVVHKPEESDKDNGDGNKLQTPVKDDSNGQVKAKSYSHVKDDSNVDKLHSPVKDRVKESIQELTPEDKRAKLKMTLSKVETDHKNLKKRFKNYIYNPPDLDVDQERRKLVKRKLKALKSERSAFELSAIHNYHEESRNSATSSTSFKTIDPVALMTDKIGTKWGGRVKGDEARKMIARMEINPLMGLASVDSSHPPFVWSSVPDHYTYLGLISTPEKFLATSYDRQLLSQYDKEVMDAVNKDLYGGEIGQLKNLEDMKRIRQHTSDNEHERGDTNSGTRARRG